MPILKPMKGGVSKQQLPRNLVGNLAYFIVNLMIGLLLVPYFVSTLGVAAYGIIPLATSLNGYVGLFTQSLNTAVARFLTVDLQQENYDSANKTFNTAFFGVSGIILAMVPVVLLISVFAPTIFDVPSGQESGAIFLFLGVNGAFLLRSWSGNFTVSLFAYNRLDLLNLVNIVNVVIQVLLIILFFSIAQPSLTLIGLAYLIGGVTASILAIVLSRRINPHLKVRLSDFTPSRLRELTGMGGWVVVNQIGSLLYRNIDLIVVNMFFGALAGGEYAIALQWVILLRAIAHTLAAVNTPIILSYYARDKIKPLIKVSKSAVKLMGLLMALPIGLVCGFAPSLLGIWIGEEYSFLALLMVVLTGHLTVNLAVLPLFSINVAYNRVKIPGILTLIMGAGNLLLAIALSVYTGWGYFGVAVAAAITLTLKNALFTPWYATRILKIPANTFTNSMLPGIIATVAIAGIAAVLNMTFQVTTLPGLIIAGGMIGIAYLAALWPFSLDEFERALFLSYLPKKIRRNVK
ncbi:oligosaccharide flippase family protein [Methanoculleus caldifontis]|nr:oligosaccharide flippase family protein [Methanoculleus sp. Wushi-C6]